MTKEEAKKFGLNLLHGIMERNESYPVYANNIKQAIDALSEESSSSEMPNELEEAATEFANQDCVTFISRVKGFKAGAEWMKAKMMEDAVEGIDAEIENYYGNIPDDKDKIESARHFAAWQKGNIKNLLKSWAENELDEYPNKNDDFRLAIYSLMDKLNDL